MGQKTKPKHVKLMLKLERQKLLKQKTKLKHVKLLLWNLKLKPKLVKLKLLHEKMKPNKLRLHSKLLKMKSVLHWLKSEDKKKNTKQRSKIVKNVLKLLELSKPTKPKLNWLN